MINFRSLLLLLALLPSILFAQKRKEIKKYKIKSVTEWTTLYESGKVSATFKSQYTAFNKEGKTIEDTEFNRDGTLKKKETVTYNKNSDKVEETKFDNEQSQPKEKGTKKISYSYNGDNEKTEEIRFLENKMVKKSVFQYNSLGEKTAELIYDENSKLKKKHLFIYNGQSLKIENKVYNGQDVLESVKKYTYEF